jgi:hypothetical protein
VRHALFVTTVFLLLSGSSLADDLYWVGLGNRSDAMALRASAVEALCWVDGGYLVLAEGESGELIVQSGLEYKLLAEDVSKEQLAFDWRMDDENVRRHRVVYEAEWLRLLLIDNRSAALTDRAGFFRDLSENVAIEYYTEPETRRTSVQPDGNLEELIAEISQDSLYAYICSLQAYPYRTSGSTPNAAARDWVFEKFQEFGYDSVVLDYFPHYFTDCYNAVAYKPGSLYPERQIIVGGHFDAVDVSPGADDNASGTAGVLEIARVLKEVELPVTLVFIAFDAEERGLLGSYHVADSVAGREDVVFVMNMDMIGAENNVANAELYYGPERGYAVLWNELAQNYSGINGIMSGTSSRSDHFPFQQAGFDVVFSHERIGSMVYHTSRDSTTHMDFDYCTRMVQASLATVYTVGRLPRAMAITGIRQVGDGQSLYLAWIPAAWPNLIQYQVGYYPTALPSDLRWIIVSPGDTGCIVPDLTQGEEYTFFIQAVDADDRASLPYYRCVSEIPKSVPDPPEAIAAMPLHRAIKVTWKANNTELDLDHYDLIRDGQLCARMSDTTHIDRATLANEWHTYQVLAVDSDGNQSSALGSGSTRAATLRPNHILAINRSTSKAADFVSAFETGVFLSEALEGYQFDYYCDTIARVDPYALPQLDLADMLDYGILVIGAESGKWDDIGDSPLYFNGILDTLAYYMSIGGKAVIFGRWGDVGDFDTTDYVQNIYDYDDAYKNIFHIDYRVLTPTLMDLQDIDTITADLIGARSSADGYPHLVWDSARTMVHTAAHTLPVSCVTGVPCESYVELTSSTPEVIYQYHSRHTDPHTDGKPVAWRYLGQDYQYVYFDIPLSFFERQAAIAALHRALEDLMGSTTPVAGNDPTMPGPFALHQNYPNPFNPNTLIEYNLPASADVELAVYNLLGQRVRKLVDERQTAGRKSVEWDSRNDTGEQVASGLYFYRLTAGDFSAARKMLLLK